MIIIQRFCCCCWRGLRRIVCQIILTTAKESIETWSKFRVCMWVSVLLFHLHTAKCKHWMCFIAVVFRKWSVFDTGCVFPYSWLHVNCLDGVCAAIHSPTYLIRYSFNTVNIFDTWFPSYDGYDVEQWLHRVRMVERYFRVSTECCRIEIAITYNSFAADYTVNEWPTNQQRVLLFSMKHKKWRLLYLETMSSKLHPYVWLLICFWLLWRRQKSIVNVW